MAARTRRKKPAARPARSAVRKLTSNLAGAVGQLRSVEAKVEKQVRHLVRGKKLGRKEAARALQGLRRRVNKERRAAMKRIDGGLRGLQDRVRRDGQTASRLAEDAVRRTLAALNIPSRREIIELTHKVDELSRRISTLKPRR